MNDQYFVPGTGGDWILETDEHEHVKDTLKFVGQVGNRYGWDTSWTVRK